MGGAVSDVNSKKSAPTNYKMSQDRASASDVGRPGVIVISLRVRVIRSCKPVYSFRLVSEFALKRLTGEFDLESITVLELSGRGMCDVT